MNGKVIPIPHHLESGLYICIYTVDHINNNYVYMSSFHTILVNRFVRIVRIIRIVRIVRVVSTKASVVSIVSPTLFRIS